MDFDIFVGGARMHVTVRLHGSFRVGRFREEVRAYPEGTAAAQVVLDLDIPLTQPDIVIINDERATLDRVLHDGDLLALFPLVAGG